MPGKYVVIDADGSVSFDADQEEPESFASAAVAPVGHVEIKPTK